ncbi:MAG: wax ester/triacylglycerol synthase family O-acyltransferase, partial [Roseiarcus sp.]
RLSALDAYFLYLESPETPTHFGSLAIFGPAAASGERLFESFRDHTVAQFDLLPSYRRRPRTMPLAIDHPVWVDVDSLDLDYHIRHMALPRPGTMEQLRSLVAELHMTLLDRRRPLWQYYLIEGLEDGGFAVYVKVHHADMDGVAGMAILPFIFDLSPDPPPIDTRTARVAKAESPDFPRLIGAAFADFIGQGVRLIRSLPAAARTVAKIARRPGEDVRYLIAVARDTPKTIFNTSISGRRSFGTASVSLSEAKEVAKARGATINDIVLAICAGALRRYLSERRALPDAPLTAAVPASLRGRDDDRLNNQVLFTLCKLATDLEGPLQRLAAIKASAQDAKGLFADVKEVLTTDISVIGAPIVVTGLARLVGMTGAADLLPPAANVIISNLPGPRKPFYFSGAAATHYFPVSIPYHGCALNVTVQSYLDNLDFGLIACRAAVPDTQRIASFLVEEFELLKRASEALSRPDAIETIEIAPSVSSAGVSPARVKPRPQAAERPSAAKPIRAAAKSANTVKRTAPTSSGRANRRAASEPGPAKT